MDLRLLEILRCPFCGGGLELDRNARLDIQDREVRSGILFCQCCAYPVVSGIPYLRTGKAAHRAMDLLGKGDPWAASAALLGLEGSQKEAFEALLNERQLTFRRALDSLCHDAEGTYLLYRFSDPTYLAGHTLLEAVAQDPVCAAGRALDLCGGAGHLTRTLCRAAGRGGVVLADITFWKLWLAKQFVAPDCQPVCCDANEPLPFARDSFSLIVCSDAFHYLWRKRLVADETVRLAGQRGAVLLAHLHNALCDNPSAGMPLTPAGYRGLFDGTPARLFSDGQLLEAGLTGRGVDLSAHELDDALASEPSLALIATHRPGLFRAYAPAEVAVEAPELTVNPLYAMRENGKVTLELQFPSPDYELEFGGCRRYLPAAVELEAGTLEGRRVTRRNAATERLVEQRVLLDLPVRYL